jgi:excinuclease ABC subunit B
VKHLLDEIRTRAERDERVLVTALTKRLAEDLATFFQEQNVRCRWLHSELDAFERVELLKDLRTGCFDCLVGVNLLREGLDLPEVSLVAILDADKEGFLRSETSLVQTIGRAARNANSKVILYADKVTEAMRFAIDETERRRAIQHKYNEEHGITPQTVRKAVKAGIETDAAKRRQTAVAAQETSDSQYITIEYVDSVEREMLAAAEALEFEKAASLRDRVVRLKENLGKPLSEIEFPKSQADSGRRKRGRKGLRPKQGGTKVPRPKKH